MEEPLEKASELTEVCDHRWDERAVGFEDFPDDLIARKGDLGGFVRVPLPAKLLRLSISQARLT